ncbi:hypothetical protein [Butyricicoccus pullicaecorum]|uniref:Uncharacterized protein n=1 Tax=Butyricicoccus pullicaecorum TaxID=501571 RepID=A0A1Y4LU02_9FIRM|nr:hypothetical protein [Butyricicoccus pullicaecorum]OUP60107.1 hypothetical protein B5F15_02295 [Butyricicoccus pullicaecorum]
MSKSVTVVEGRGLFIGDRMICNGIPEIVEAFHRPGDSAPTCIRIRIRIGSFVDQCVDVAVGDLGYRALHRAIPLLQCSSSRHRAVFDTYLVEITQKFLENPEKNAVRAYFFAQNGIVHLDDEATCVVLGNRVLGYKGNRCIAEPMCSWRIPEGTSDTCITLAKLLTNQPSAVLLTTAYTLLTTVRSAVIESGVDLQAVLYITGAQGLGKTTLARRVAGFVNNTDTDRPALLFDAGSTLAATRDAMASARDLPIVVDDLCLSASRAAQQQRKDLGAKLVREAANVTEIIKKAPGGQTITLQNVAGVIMTAEFMLENASDVTRCVMAPITQPLDLPNELTPELMAGVVQEFLQHFLRDPQSMLKRLHNFMQNNEHIAALQSCTEQRVRTNLTALYWAFREFVAIFATNIQFDNLARDLVRNFNRALADSVTQTDAALARVRSLTPEGNIAYVLLNAYLGDNFNLLKEGKKLTKLSKYDGTTFKGDLCLRKCALQQVVNQSPGYRGWGLNHIVAELVSYGALRIQEEGTYQVKLSSDTEVPRVYRIKVDTLEKFAERY